MESVYHIVAIRVNETSWAHVWRLRLHYLGTWYDTDAANMISYRPLIDDHTHMPQVRVPMKQL
jgi:hypothetical protein